MKCFLHQICMLTVIALMAGDVIANPAPAEVANTVSNLWASEEFSALNSYITNLYASSSNYVPSILASSFRDSIYLGKLSDSTSRLARVQAAVNINTNGFTVEFRGFLAELMAATTREIGLHARMGTTPEMLQSNASPSAVYNAWDGLTLPQINILFYAPATNAP